MKFHSTVIAALVSALALTSCAAPLPLLSGLVIDVGQKGKSQYYVVELKDDAGAVVIYDCNSYEEPVCALLDKGDWVHFVSPYDWVDRMEDVVRTATAEDA